MRLIWWDQEGYSQPIHYKQPLCGVLKKGRRPAHVEMTQADLELILADPAYGVKWLEVLKSALRGEYHE